MSNGRSLLLVFFLLILLSGCGVSEAIPDESMFDLNVTLPETIHADQTVMIQVDLTNNSKYTWEGMHGLDLFKFKVKDTQGNEVSTYEGIRVVDALGISIKLRSKEIYEFYKSDRYQENLNQITIKNPGIYMLEVSCDIGINHKEKEYPLTIKAEPIEIIIQ